LAPLLFVVLVEESRDNLDDREILIVTAQAQNSGRAWYLVYTKPRQEEVALANLVRQGYGAYLPQVRQVRRRQGRRLNVVEPLFPRYLFIHLNAGTDNWGPIRSTVGVASLVRFGQEPGRVPDALVAFLQDREGAEGLHEWAEPAKLAAGDRVRVAEGAFQGYQGILLSRSGRGCWFCSIFWVSRFELRSRRPSLSVATNGPGIVGKRRKISVRSLEP
jgi:transcriptional antiterminator RfaH